MYPQLLCNSKYKDLTDLNTDLDIMSETTTTTPTPSTQKLQPSAAPFEPKKRIQQQLNEAIQPNENIQEIIEMPAHDRNDNIHVEPMPTDKISVMPQIQAEQSCPKEDLETSYHPLQHIWTLWYLETDRSKTWEEMQNEISSVNSVEDFWRLHNYIKPASEIKAGCDYSLFKHGIRPMWEDEANRNGGRWIINLPRMLPNYELDNIWLDVLLCLIGETFENTDQLCGAVVNVRNKNNKISVWTKDGQNTKAILEIGSKLRDLLHLAPQQLHYQLHKDTMTKTNGCVRSLFIL